MGGLDDMKQVQAQEARKNFRVLLDGALKGESTTVTRNGQPVAVLVPSDVWEGAVADRRALLGIVWGWIEKANDGVGGDVGDLQWDLEQAGYLPPSE